MVADGFGALLDIEVLLRGEDSEVGREGDVGNAARRSAEAECVSEVEESVGEDPVPRAGEHEPQSGGLSFEDLFGLKFATVSARACSKVGGLLW